jgi:hypothetical protein
VRCIGFLAGFDCLAPLDARKQGFKIDLSIDVIQKISTPCFKDDIVSRNNIKASLR